MPYIEDNPDPAARLAHYASQENCDGEPYDTMRAGADEIRQLRAERALPDFTPTLHELQAKIQDLEFLLLKTQHELDYERSRHAMSPLPQTIR